MILLAKYLPLKHENQSSDLSTHVEGRCSGANAQPYYRRDKYKWFLRARWSTYEAN